jgi:hypothetical protein
MTDAIHWHCHYVCSIFPRIADRHFTVAVRSLVNTSSVLKTHTEVSVPVSVLSQIPSYTVLDHCLSLPLMTTLQSANNDSLFMFPNTCCLSFTHLRSSSSAIASCTCFRAKIWWTWAYQIQLLPEMGKTARPRYFVGCNIHSSDDVGAHTCIRRMAAEATKCDIAELYYFEASCHPVCQYHESTRDTLYWGRRSQSLPGSSVYY